MALRADDYEVRLIPQPEWRAARQFVVEHHYSRGCSNTSVYAHGLYRKGASELLGVAMWMPPTRIAAESVNEPQWRKVLTLSRLAIRPDVPKNGATFLMGRSIRLIRRDARFVSLVTYADDFMKHTGAIYHAANWTYVGKTAKYPRWEDKSGGQVAKLATKTRTNAQMRALGHTLVGTFAKHKFVMHLKQRCEGDRIPGSAEAAILFFAAAC
ncbi:hypothetical protein U1872_06410 [Sphingomonas sp. RB3P16]|uniref:Mom family adenine methylcarbamoylation protein n=1 Tax=Parasphingomonas frigoris TaxID=3096163 RepID=UPI002FC88EE1